MRKLLSYSLKYPNILYTMDNETRVPFKWGSYWSAFIKKEASAKGIKAETSEMWDDNKLNSTRQRQSFDNPQVYSFLDVSQNNRNFNQDHWDNLQWARKYIAKAPRPMNNTKIYAGGNSSWGSGDAQQGVERFGATSSAGRRRAASTARPSMASGSTPWPNAASLRPASLRAGSSPGR